MLVNVDLKEKSSSIFNNGRSKSCGIQFSYGVTELWKRKAQLWEVESDVYISVSATLLTLF